MKDIKVVHETERKSWGRLMIDNMVYIKNLDQCRFKSQTLLHLNNTGEMISSLAAGFCTYLLSSSSAAAAITFQVQPVLVLPLSVQNKQIKWG